MKDGTTNNTPKQTEGMAKFVKATIFSLVTGVLALAFGNEPSVTADEVKPGFLFLGGVIGGYITFYFWAELLLVFTVGSIIDAFKGKK